MKRASTTLAAFAALSLIFAACSSDDDAADSTTAATTAPVATEATTATAETTATEETAATEDTEATDSTEATDGTTEDTATDDTAAAGEEVSIDTNGDGKVVIGVATPGPRDDGGYYQALVDGVTAFSEAHGFEPPIVVDNIAVEEAQSALDSLARQDVDMITVGAGEIGDPLAALTEEYSDIIWFCNCNGAAGDNLPNLIQTSDDGSQNGYTAGIATGLLMQAKDAGTGAAMIGNNNFNFEIEAFKSFELGLQTIDPSYTLTYVATNSFNDVAAATEAFNNLKDQGIAAVWPYLGGSHEAVVKLANENDIITMSAGASDVCERTDLHYDIAVKFDSGDYLETVLAGILDGSIKRGDTRAFTVSVDPEVGAIICDPTPEEQEGLDAAYARIADGEMDEAVGAIKAEAYAG